MRSTTPGRANKAIAEASAKKQFEYSEPNISICVYVSYGAT